MVECLICAKYWANKVHQRAAAKGCGQSVFDPKQTFPLSLLYHTDLIVNGRDRLETAKDG